MPRPKKPTASHRATLYLEKRPLWVLQCPPNTAGVNALLWSLASAVEEHADRLEKILQPYEWRYLGACALAFGEYLFSRAASPLADIKHCALTEGPRDGLPERIWPGQGASALRVLEHRLAKLDDLDGFAILFAISHFASCPFCPTGDEAWWTVEHRVKCEMHDAAEDEREAVKRDIRAAGK